MADLYADQDEWDARDEARAARRQELGDAARAEQDRGDERFDRQAVRCPRCGRRTNRPDLHARGCVDTRVRSEVGSPPAGKPQDTREDA